jgi:prolyl oligopeptidase
VIDGLTRRLCAGLLLCATALSVHAESARAANVVTEREDPYLWLEEVTSEKALEWVRERNAAAEQQIVTYPGYADLRDDLRTILDSDARIPWVGKMGRYFYNFWRDGNHPQGIWRRTTLAEYRKGKSEWEVLLDVDALGMTEGVTWVWHGANCLKPAYDRCLISLSRSGADAQVTREFDLSARRFVIDGFVLPEAKNWIHWKDRNTTYVGTDFGPGSLTSSGYPRLAKEWRRGTPVDQAKTIFEARPDDMSVSAYRDHTRGFVRDFIERTPAFYRSELFLRTADGRQIKIDVPDSADKSVFREWLFLSLRDPYEVNGRIYPAGALIVTGFDAFMAGKREFRTLFEPTATTSLAGFSTMRSALLLNVLDDVKSRIEVWRYRASQWRSGPLRGAPGFGSLSAWSIDPEHSNDYFLSVTDFLTPTTLLMGKPGQAPVKLKEMPSFFDTSGMEIEQAFAVSRDGTRVPYFIVSRQDMIRNGDNPTLLYGYGGFEISMLPSYSGAIGRAWLSDGGVYVLANIRGGGEYGPRWHAAALKENRLRAYEDFAAVAADLATHAITRPARLGIMGGSNGGLLVGNMLTLYPTLFGAAVCQVPLLDMKRYSKLLAGASWMAEYGDPDKPEEWQFIQQFSPYQNIVKGGIYPPILFTTSTRDDRVHPGHARKMVARMLEQGHDVQYYENMEGGHGGAANNEQAAKMAALSYTYLKQRLVAPATSQP